MSGRRNGNFIALVTLILLTAHTAHGDLESALSNYNGDAAFLNLWAETFLNFPTKLWDTTAGTPCTFVGVGCEKEIDNNSYVTSIDLSYSDSFSVGNASAYIPKLRGTLDWNITGLLFLKSLSLSNNALTGPIPPELALAPSLTALQLQNNLLTGNLSETLCSLKLTCLDLSGNNISGPVPDCWRKKFNCTDFDNTLLNLRPGITCLNGTKKSCARDDRVTYAPPPGKDNSVNLVAVLVGAFGGLALILVLGSLLLLFLRHREELRKKKELEKLAADIETQISTRHFGTLRRFTVEDLSKATFQFDEDNILGEGGFSKVYKGTLPDGKNVAVKKIKEEQQKKAGAELQFLNEVELISRAVHRNLMRCEGFCVEQGTCMLVLPFYANGSVATRTQGKEGNPINWPTRQKVARGAAEGVAYLHTDCNPKLIHRDIKADNVLLDDEEEAIIADFGLAKEMDVKETHATTAIRGTVGHIAPEYFVSGQCSEKTDVYAFGVFLLELVTGKDVFELTVAPEAEEMLLRDWVADILREKKVRKILDPEMEISEKEEVEVEKMIQVALLCMQNDPSDRPGMDDVAKMLSGKGLAEKWAQWQVEAGNMRAEDLMTVVNTPAIWDNTTTGISLDAFQLSGPR